MTPTPQAVSSTPALAGSELGGKAANLRILSDAGFPVPRFTTVPVSSFRAFMRDADLQETVRTLLSQLDFSRPEAVKTASQTVQGMITSRELPEPEPISRPPPGFWRRFFAVDG